MLKVHGQALMFSPDMHKILHKNVQNAWHLSGKRCHNVVNTENWSFNHISRVSCQKGPTCHAYAWQIGPFLAGYPRYPRVQWVNFQSIIKTEWYIITKKIRLMCSITVLWIATKLQGKKIFFSFTDFQGCLLGVQSDNNDQMVVSVDSQVIYKTASSQKEAMRTQVAL